jgi:hypothetical protein
MGMSDHRHAPTAFYPLGKDPRYPLYRRLGGPQNWSGHKRLEEKSFRLCWESKLGRPVVQPVARHYTDWATRLTPLVDCIVVHIFLLYTKPNFYSQMGVMLYLTPCSICICRRRNANIYIKSPPSQITQRSCVKIVGVPWFQYAL